MIDYHRFCQIKHLHAHQGLNASQIAKTVALDRRTVAYWLAQEHFRPAQTPPARLANLIPSNRTLSVCSNVIPIPPRRSSSTYASTALTAAMGWSKPMCAPCAPGGRRPFSRWPLPPASAPRSIGARLARSRSGKRTGN